MANKKKPVEEYEVGYRKPPTHTQFKKGQSGNPNGRPRKSRWPTSTDSMRLGFIDSMERTVAVKVDGRDERKPAIHALYDALLAKALKGDLRTAKLLLETYFGFLTTEEDARVRLMELIYDIEDARDRQLQERARQRKISSRG